MSGQARVRPSDGRRPVLFGLLIMLAVFALAVSLATRTFPVTSSQGPMAQCWSTHGVRQHMDGDAAQWVPPVPVLLALQAPVFYHRVAPDDVRLPSLHFDENLYNRPPPSC